MTIETSVHETSDFILAELSKRKINGEWWHTGGGCTAIQIPLPGKGRDGEDAIICITDQNAGVDLTIDRRDTFVGWIAGFYPTDDDFMYGENEEWIHGGKLYLPNDQVDVPLITVTDAKGEPVIDWQGKIMQVPDWPVLDWKADAVAMADAIATFIEGLNG